MDEQTIKTHRMTADEFLTRMDELRASWATQSNATEDEGELISLCEQFIGEMDKALGAAGGHPTPPPPRIRH